MTDNVSVKAAVLTIQGAEGHLDVLINNAGISGGMIGPEKMTVATMQEAFDTNVFGIVRVIHAFLPLLHKWLTAVVVDVSSGLGSFGSVLNESKIELKVHAGVYNSSKAAVNMLTLQDAKALSGVLVNSGDPGYTATDLSHHTGTKTVTEGTDAIVKMASIGKKGPTSTFSDRHDVLPW